MDKILHQLGCSKILKTDHLRIFEHPQLVQDFVHQPYQSKLAQKSWTAYLINWCISVQIDLPFPEINIRIEVVSSDNTILHVVQSMVVRTCTQSICLRVKLQSTRDFVGPWGLFKSSWIKGYISIVYRTLSIPRLKLCRIFIQAIWDSSRVELTFFKQHTNLWVQVKNVYKQVKAHVWWPCDVLRKHLSNDALVLCILG